MKRALADASTLLLLVKNADATKLADDVIGWKQLLDDEPLSGHQE